MNRLELFRKLTSEFPNAKLQGTDSTYGVPDSEWVRGKCYWMFEENMRKNDLYKWRVFHDCDNKAFSFWQFVSDCHCKTMIDREKRGLPIMEGVSLGVLFFEQDGGVGHAINILITETGVKAFEPQTGEFIQLSKGERESAWFAIF